MKCDNCTNVAEYGIDGEETVLCADCFVEAEEKEEKAIENIPAKRQKAKRKMGIAKSFIPKKTL